MDTGTTKEDEMTERESITLNAAYLKAVAAMKKLEEKATTICERENKQPGQGLASRLTYAARNALNALENA